MRNEPWVWPEVRDAGTSGAGAVPLRSAQLMGQQKKRKKEKKKPIICAPPRLSEVSPTLPLKRFQCSTDDGPLSSFQGRSSSASSFHASPPGDRWCDVLGFVPAGILKLLNTSDLPRSKPLVRVALPASLSARSFPFTPACPGQYTHRSFRRWMSTIDTFQSGLPTPL